MGKILGGLKVAYRWLTGGLVIFGRKRILRKGQNDERKMVHVEMFSIHQAAARRVVVRGWEEDTDANL